METYNELIEKTKEYGVAEEIRHPLILVRGLSGATINEIVVFENGQTGHVFALTSEFVQVITLSDEPIRPGTKVARSGEHVSITVNDSLLGQLINPLGQILTANETTQTTGEKRPLDVVPPHISKRSKITKGFTTGSSLVDLLLPLGMGQRQMILGDQKTGKTSFLLTTIQAAISSHIVIYTAIGKPWNAISQVHEIISHDPAIKEKTIIVGAHASDVPSMIVLAPFTAMSIAEYFRDQGQDVLIIMDDMSTHAAAYREISLLAKRFPGRESYPGDIFHLHAKLLERAGSFKNTKTGESTITCLAVAETVHSNLTSYIVSNLISITDGHLLFDSSIFNQGRRPAVDVTLSVTRVGRQTQTQLHRQLRSKMIDLLHKYNQAQNYSQFGAELSTELQQSISLGNKLLSFFSQGLLSPIPLSVQTIMAVLVIEESLEDITTTPIATLRDCLAKRYYEDTTLKILLDTMAEVGTIDMLVEQIKKHKDTILAPCPKEAH